NARLDFTNFHKVTVDGNVVASAHASDVFSGAANAHAGVDFGGAGSISLGGVQINVTALRSGRSTGGHATASFVETNRAVKLTIGSGGINVQATAGAVFGAGALANALVDLHQNDIAVAGGIHVGANAFNASSGSGEARAVANLALDAAAGG